jgi:hypothetical protein
MWKLAFFGGWIYWYIHDHIHDYLLVILETWTSYNYVFYFDSNTKNHLINIIPINF